MVIFAAIGVLLVSALYIYYLFLNPSIKSKEDRDIIYYTAVLKKNPEDPDAYVNLAAAYAQKQEYDRSQKLLTEGMKKFPKDFRFPIEIAKNYYKIGSLSQSEKYAKKALDIRNDLSIAYYLLGKIRYRQRRIDEAQTYFSRAIKYDPYNADYYYELGKIYEEKGYRKQAIDLYKKALEYGPDLQKVRDSLERLNENAER
ncbi:MAG: tetratricopeptide repeat protein [Actinobacteria bacterium]|nr:tetratricopeptide repeat protein [Actinomycetota bacterium]